jgi:hypothetical protein
MTEEDKEMCEILDEDESVVAMSHRRGNYDVLQDEAHFVERMIQMLGRETYHLNRLPKEIIEDVFQLAGVPTGGYIVFHVLTHILPSEQHPGHLTAYYEMWYLRILGYEAARVFRVRNITSRVLPKRVIFRGKMEMKPSGRFNVFENERGRRRRQESDQYEALECRCSIITPYQLMCAVQPRLPRDARELPEVYGGVWPCDTVVFGPAKNMRYGNAVSVFESAWRGQPHDMSTVQGRNATYMYLLSNVPIGTSFVLSSQTPEGADDIARILQLTSDPVIYGDRMVIGAGVYEVRGPESSILERFEDNPIDLTADDRRSRPRPRPHPSSSAGASSSTGSSSNAGASSSSSNGNHMA